MKHRSGLLLKGGAGAAALFAASAFTSVVAAGYEVEMVFFEHRDANTGDERFFPAETSSAQPDDGLLLFHGAPEGVPGYWPLPETDMQKRREYVLLQQSVDYDPIWHGGWRQPALRRPQGIALRTVTACGSSLAGTAYLRDRGSLHLELDLRYQPCPASGTDVRTLSIPVRHRRQVLLNLLYYFDHPLLGVLFEVRRN